MQHPFPRNIPAHSGPPASADPIADLVRHGPPGLTTDAHYLVLPVPLLTEMDVPFQQRFATELDQYARRYAGHHWPTYRVTPTVRRQLADCDEQQLAELGILGEHAPDGSGVVYRDRQTLQPLPPEQEVAVSCADPLLTSAPAAPPPPASPPQAPPARPDDYPAPW